MSNEELGMRKEKNCVDCLHSKVSVKSTEKCRLCFCAETVKKHRHKEPYWTAKLVCRKFEDMAC